MARSLSNDALRDLMKVECSPRKPRQRPEFHIEQTCSEWLALDSWRAIITDPPQLRGLGVSEKGIPDRLYIRYAKFDRAALRAAGDDAYTRHPAWAELTWIEWKSPKGTPSVKQLEWHAAERARGALTLIAGRDFERTIEGFQKFYRQSGLMRRKI